LLLLGIFRRISLHSFKLALGDIVQRGFAGADRPSLVLIDSELNVTDRYQKAPTAFNAYSQITVYRLNVRVVLIADGVYPAPRVIGAYGYSAARLVSELICIADGNPFNGRASARTDCAACR